MSHFTEKGAYQGMHKIYLSNGRKPLFMFVDRHAWLNGNIIRGRHKSFAAFMMTATAIWRIAGVSVNRWTSGNVSHTWGRVSMTGPFNCELICAGTKTRHYSEMELDDSTIRRWYVRLNRRVEDIDGALDESGRLTEWFTSVLLEGLWDYGLTGSTGLSPHSPTGRVCTSLYIRFVGRRVIVENQHYMDI